ERPDGDRVVWLVDDEDAHTGALELEHGTPRRQRDDRDVIAGRVDPGHEREEMLLRATVGARRKHLDDADASPGKPGMRNGFETGVARSGGAHVSRSAAARAGAGWARP